MVVLPASHFPTYYFCAVGRSSSGKTEAYAAQDAARHAQAADVTTGRDRGRDLDHNRSSPALTVAVVPLGIDYGEVSGVYRRAE